MANFSHTDEYGHAKMVDVSNKTPQLRRASASGKIFLAPETIELIRQNQIQKGDVLTIAKIAGIQAAKQTAYLIPLCHPLTIDNINVQSHITQNGIVAESEVKCVGKTGIEMEALTVVTVTLLTIYDMCKAVDKNMQISEIKLLTKEKQNV
ncbi:MAG: molybdenum cofactor biosynthesis protein MoaC [Coxiella sp. DG_40]|nr:MAG: molybdenum cofactor biosynthesis protein MoaC [Coxiella sp. DG_40]